MAASGVEMGSAKRKAIIKQAWEPPDPPGRKGSGSDVQGRKGKLGKMVSEKWCQGQYNPDLIAGYCP